MRVAGALLVLLGTVVGCGGSDGETHGGGAGAPGSAGNPGGGGNATGSGGADARSGTGGAAASGTSGTGASGTHTGGGGAGGGGGSAAGHAGTSSTTGGAAGNDSGSGTVWYDGEASGLPASAGVATLSAGSTATEVADNCHAGGKCLRVSLDASTAWGHLAWAPSLDNKSYDLTAHANLEFWIRGESGAPTDLQLEMHGPGGGCPWVAVKDALPGGVTMDWQKVSVPLASFKLDLKQIQVVDFWLTANQVAFVIDDGRWN